VLLCLTYLAVANTCALVRLLTMSDREKDVEILALRHQSLVLRCWYGRIRFCAGTVT
jgi:putative transposase